MTTRTIGSVVSRRLDRSLRRVIVLVALLVALLLACLAPAAVATAAEPVVVPAADRVDLTGRLEWCETSPERTIEEVLGGACRFGPMRTGGTAVGYSRRAYWLRLTLVAGWEPTEERWLVVGSRRLERVTYRVTDAAGRVTTVETGLAIAPSARPVLATDPVLPLRLGEGEQATIVARVLSATSINLATTLWRPRAHQEARGRLEFWEAAAVGGMLAAASFSLMIAFAGGVSQWSRRANLWFGLVLIAKAVFNAANAALLPGHLLPIDRPLDVRVQAVAMGTATVFFLLFLRHLVDSRRRWPRWEAILRLLIVAVVAETGWAILVDYPLGFQALNLSSAAVIFAAVVLFWQSRRAGFPAAGYLLVAFALNLVQLLHRVALAFAGQPFDDVLLLLYSWSYLLATPLIAIGIALHEEALRVAAEAARAEATARVEFLARVSHELRTPLDTILGNAQLLSRPSGAPLMREGLAIIRDSGRHLLRMIDDLLDHARGVAGRLAITPIAVDWPTFLATLELSGRTLAERRGNAFVLRTTGATPHFLGLDEGRLRQILDNLVGNAARHTDHGRIEVSCDVSTLAPDGRVVIGFVVTDTGEGIAAADLERIFLPFERSGHVDARRGGKGIGMGLTIARQLVEAMGGRLTVTSRPGEGAAFRFTVDAEAIDAAAPMPGEAPFSAVVGRGRTLLIVEDEVANRRVLVHFFRDSGFTVIEAASGRTAIEAAATVAAIDLIVTDQFMADGDGWAVLRDSAALYPETPVVLVSAAPPEPPTDFPRSLRFAAHFLKPLDHARLLGTVVELLGLSLEPEGTEVRASAAAPAFARPGEAELAELRTLVDDGRVGEVKRRADVLERSDPALAEFAEALRTAAARLDLEALAALLNDGSRS